MSGYTVIYFPARGRAELTRLTLAAAGQEWTEQVVTGENIADFKKTDNCLFGQVPVLLDGEKAIAQSVAMARHVARKHDLLGDLDQGVTADMILAHWADILNAVCVFFCCCCCLSPLFLSLVYFPGASVEKLEAYATETLPGKLVPFINILKNNEGKGFVAGDSFSFADVALFQITEALLDNV